MVEGLESSGREIVTDIFFTSVELSDELHKKKLYLTGTMRKNRNELPKEFLPNKSRPENSFLVGYHDDKMLSSIVTNKNKAVIFLTNNPRLQLATKANNGKLPVNEHYNKTKAGVDLLDKITKEYSLTKPCNRWPYTCFSNILEIMLHNAFVLFVLRHPEWQSKNRQKRQLFLSTLAYQLALEQVEDRLEKANGKHYQKQLTDDMLRFIKYARNDDHQQLARNECEACLEKASLINCKKCSRMFCASHILTRSEYVCLACTGEPASHRKSATKSICYYCVHGKIRSSIFCATCAACICKTHRAKVFHKYCENCSN